MQRHSSLWQNIKSLWQKVEDKEKRKANEHSAGITYSTRRDPWVLRLSKVISKNYCCESFSRREKGKQTYKLYFCGLNEDVEICMIAFKYATDCIQSEIKKRKQKGKLFNYTNELITSMCNGYAYGFIKGLDEAFEEQKRAAALRGKLGLSVIYASRSKTKNV